MALLGGSLGAFCKEERKVLAGGGVGVESIDEPHMGAALGLWKPGRECWSRLAREGQLRRASRRRTPGLRNLCQTKEAADQGNCRERSTERCWDSSNWKGEGGRNYGETAQSPGADGSHDRDESADPSGASEGAAETK
jgi:hypothetical protein